MRILIDFDSKNFRRVRRAGRALIVGGALAVPLWSIASQVGPIVGPMVTFSPGQGIRASDFNQNFQALATAVGTTDNKVTSLSGQVASLPGAIAALQGQVTTLQTQNTTLQSQNNTLQQQLQAFKFGLKFQGELDPTFNGTGAVVQGDLGFTWAATLDANGKILTAGEDLTLGAMTLRRFNTDGSVDTTFNPTGPSPGLATYTPPPGCVGPPVGYALAVDQMGRIDVAGVSSRTLMTVWRFSSAGVLDPTFGHVDTTYGPQGFVDTALGNSAVGNGIAIDASGNAVVVGQTTTGPTASLAVWRITSTGQLDTTFGGSGGGGGGFVTDVGKGSPAEGSAVVIDASGNIVVAGTSTDSTTTPTSEMTIWRYVGTGGLTGLLDSTFNASTGFLAITPNGVGASGYALALDGSGGIVVAGGSSANGGTVCRVTNAGTLDTSFGLGTGYFVNLTSQTTGNLRGVAFDASGRILVAGIDGNTSGAIVERIGAFGQDGSALGPLQSQGYGLVVDGQGRLIVPGAVSGPHEAVFRFAAQ
jgi:uncharacterized delta-60 repeat protein